MSIRISTWRWLAKFLQAMLVLGIPFIKINGESALRFDVSALTLYLFGARIAMDEFFLVLIAILVLSFLAAVLTVLFGRIWCGWVCPQTVVTELTGFLGCSLDRGTPIYAGSLIMFIPISALLGASMIWYFVSPYEFIDRLWSHTLGNVIGTLWAIATLVTFVNIVFIRRTFCATICPYAKMQGMLFDEQTLIIAMDPKRKNECMGCDACVRACPVGIDVRKGLQAACVNCAACIDACADRMVRKKRRSLIGYRFGLFSERPGFWRKGVVLSTTGTVIFITLLTFLIIFRPGIEIVVVPASGSMPRITSDGKLLNMFSLTITNRTGSDRELSVSAINGAGELMVVPDRVQVRNNGQERITIAVKAPATALDGRYSEQISIIVASKTEPRLSTFQKISLQRLR